MASQLVIKGQIVMIEENIQFSFNSGQIANLSISQSNYTEAFKIPRTSQENVVLFESLGIPSDASSLPYSINEVDVLQDYNIIYSGTLVILKTDELYYQATVISGTRDVFQLLGDKTFYDIPDIKNSIPSKNTANVASLAIWGGGNVPMIFSFANYGGITHLIDSGNVYVNVDCMSISFHVIHLWNSIFNFIGISNNITDLIGSDRERQYFTFPYPPFSESLDGDVLTFSGINPSSAGNVSGGANPSGSNSWTNVSGSGWGISGRALTCFVSQQYLFEFPDGFVGQWFENLSKPKKKLTITLTRNGTPFASFESDISVFPDRTPIKFVEFFNAGDVFNFTLSYEGTSGITWYTGSNLLKISTVKLSEDTLKEMLNFKLADYVKEFMYKYSLIGYRKDNILYFKKIGSILNSENSVDWSDKFVKRIEESYDIGFNQHNFLKHKYVNEGSNYYDGDIQSNNLNLPYSKDLISSNVFVPSQNSALFSLGGAASSSNDTLVKGYVTYTTDSNDNVKTEKRNFWQQIEPWPTSSVYLGSFINSDRYTLFGQQVNKSNTFSTGFNSNYWNVMTEITYQTKYHVFELNLTEIDILQIDQGLPYYFKQEAAFYMLNELTYTYGQKATGKFTKINRP